MAQTRGNSLSPIASLPIELLALVFELLVPLTRSNNRPMSAPTAWLIVMQVCRTWCDVALGYPALWSELSTFSPRQPWDVYLRRACTSPLSIRAVITSATQVYPRFIADHLHHIRILYVDNTDDFIFPIISQAKLATELQTLELSLSKHRRNRNVPSPVLPPDFFSVIAPNICAVSLRGYHFPWSANAANLRSLNVDLALDADYQHEMWPFTTRDVLQGLRRMPTLERLSLTRFCVASPDPIDEHDIVSLPNLIDFSAKGLGQGVFELWRILRPHPRAGIIIFGEDAVKFDANLHHASSALSTHLSMPNSSVFTDLDFEVLSNRLVFTLKSPVSELQPDLKLCLRAPITTTARSDALVQLLTSIPMQFIRRLKLSNICPLSTDEWRAILTPAKSLAHLHLCGILDLNSDMTSLFSVLTPPMEASRFKTGESRGKRTRLGRPGLPPLLPSLGSIKLTAIHFGHDHSTPESPELYDLVFHMLEARAGSEHKLETLTIHDCSIRSVAVAAFEKLVGTVQWDSYQGDYSDTEDEEDYNADDLFGGSGGFGFGLTDEEMDHGDLCVDFPFENITLLTVLIAVLYSAIWTDDLW
jgi:hypothetical protein